MGISTKLNKNALNSGETDYNNIIFDDDKNYKLVGNFTFDVQIINGCVLNNSGFNIKEFIDYIKSIGGTIIKSERYGTPKLYISIGDVNYFWIDSVNKYIGNIDYADNNITTYYLVKDSDYIEELLIKRVEKFYNIDEVEL